MTREELAKLLEKFISKKGRPFKAYLVWDEKKKQTGFEFEPRKPEKNTAKKFTSKPKDESNASDKK